MTKVIISIANGHSPRTVASSLEPFGFRMTSMPWWTGSIVGVVDNPDQVEKIKSVQGVYLVEITK